MKGIVPLSKENVLVEGLVDVEKPHIRNEIGKHNLRRVEV